MAPMTATLRGKVALVTGAGRGIGRAIAVALGGAGVSVGCVARSEAELEQCVALVEAAGAAAVVAIADLADPVALAAAIETVEGAFGAIDLLVNNAGIVGPLGPTFEVSAEEYERAVLVNLLAPVRLSLALLPQMRRQGFGRILNISSGAARNTTSGDPMNAYITTKSALEGHTTSLAAELVGSGVTANVLRPGMVDTPMQELMRTQDADQLGAAFVDRFRSRFEAGELLAPEAPAALAVELLAGEENGAIVSYTDRAGATS
jgi:3-oxoacyl-[acyl-carrier protein] reductase